MQGFTFNPPPGWPPPPPGWTPPERWQPDPTWPPAPAGWNFWIPTPEEPTTPDEITDGPSDPSGDGTEPQTSEPADSVNAALRAEQSTDPTTANDHHRETHTEVDAREQAAALLAELDHLRSQVETERATLHQLQQATTKDEEESEVRSLQEQIQRLRSELVELDDAALLQQVGIYEYHHPLENAAAYKEQLASLRERIRASVKTGDAITASERFSYNNSLAQGRKMVADFSKLMLRAYNAEADNCVRSLRAGTSTAATKRLTSAAESIARLGSMMDMRVADDYQTLRIEEIELTSDYLIKIQEEREAAREERERLREERKAEQEIAAERARLEKERDHYQNVLESLRASGATTEATDLQQRLSEIGNAIEVNDYRAANIRAGYVYVISNIGAFGKRVVKIGMTRRLEPMDRIRELGDASVPFPFDVHALYFSDDAVTLESELHKEFADRRLNQVNLRREFFFASPEQVRQVLAEKVGNLLEFTDQPEATQYYQSSSSWGAETRLR